MIAYGAVQKAIQSLSFAEDLELLNKCIIVLSYCALKDALAGRFRDLLTSQLDDLQRLHVPETNSRHGSMLDEAALPDILFTFDSGSSKLHAAARGLLNLIHRPFSGLSDISTQATLSNRVETTLGTHLEWEWELKSSDCVEKTTDPMEVCGRDAVSAPLAEPLLLQSQGGAWSVWTPPIGI